MMQDLILVGDKMPSLFAVAGDSGAGHGQFYPEIQFDGGIDNRVKAEDLLDPKPFYFLPADEDYQHSG